MIRLAPDGPAFIAIFEYRPSRWQKECIFAYQWLCLATFNNPIMWNGLRFDWNQFGTKKKQWIILYHIWRVDIIDTYGYIGGQTLHILGGNAGKWGQQTTSAIFLFRYIFEIIVNNTAGAFNLLLQMILEKWHHREGFILIA